DQAEAAAARRRCRLHLRPRRGIEHRPGTDDESVPDRRDVGARLASCLSMTSAQTRFAFVAREKPLRTFPDHALTSGLLHQPCGGQRPRDDAADIDTLASRLALLPGLLLSRTAAAADGHRLGLARRHGDGHRDRVGVLARHPGRRDLRLPDLVGQAEEARDVIGRGDPGFDQERALDAVTLVIAGQPERRAVRHVGDRVGFDQRLAVGIPPHLARMAVDIGSRHRRKRQAVQVEPLPNDRIGIARMHGAVGAAVPHRYPRPIALVLGR
ncbi:hypothetical protein chiPu_0029887, partial [Chiloscyllium punctatum]|nr:hypothetical protein [Chiloscyllium punctatum]